MRVKSQWMGKDIQQPVLIDVGDKVNEIVRSVRTSSSAAEDALLDTSSGVGANRKWLSSCGSTHGRGRRIDE